MRTLLAVLFPCLVGCMCVPPTTNGVFYDGSCAVHWQPEDFPLEVVVERQITPDQRIALEDAIRIWNDAVGAEVFHITRELNWYDPEWLRRRSGTIYVLVADIPDINPPLTTLGLCSTNWNICRMHDAIVSLDITVQDGNDATVVFVHELGHALALRHDRSQESIMYRHALASGKRIFQDDINYIRWEMTHGY